MEPNFSGSLAKLSPNYGQSHDSKRNHLRKYTYDGNLRHLVEDRLVCKDNTLQDFKQAFESSGLRSRQCERLAFGWCKQRISYFANVVTLTDQLNVQHDDQGLKLLVVVCGA